MKTSAPAQRVAQRAACSPRGWCARRSEHAARRPGPRGRRGRRRRLSATTTSPRPGGEQQLEDRHAGRPGARTARCVRRRACLPTTSQRVDQRGEHDDRGAVLVVVEDRDVEAGAQPALDLEAARCRDVLEVDAREHRGDQLDGPDDLVDVLGVEADRERVDAGEPLEQRRLALHHRQRGHRTEVAQPEHRGAVGDDGDGVALDGQPAGVARGSPRCARQTRATPGV